MAKNMTQKQEMKEAIQSVIKLMMERVLNTVLVEDPFVKEEHKAKKPLYAALVPDEIFKGSHFERRFVTPFGGVWEKLAIVAANKGLGYGEKGRTITGKVNAERLRRIQEVLNNLEHGVKEKKRIKPDWDNELKYILQGKSTKLIPVTVISDVYAEDKKNKKKYTFELKAPLPNSDQTKVSKEKMLKLYSMEPCQNDRAVLIGDEFWEKIGGLGTYKAFIDAVNEIGKEYKDRIYREFLGIEPPTHLDE